jgi:hypothetical protein
VDAALGLEIAIGVLALDQQGRRLDPGLLARMMVDQLDLQPWRSAQRVYMRCSISAQSWLSVPPAPALTST